MTIFEQLLYQALEAKKKYWAKTLRPGAPIVVFDRLMQAREIANFYTSLTVAWSSLFGIRVMKDFGLPFWRVPLLNIDFKLELPAIEDFMKGLTVKLVPLDFAQQLREYLGIEVPEYLLESWSITIPQEIVDYLSNVVANDAYLGYLQSLADLYKKNIIPEELALDAIRFCEAASSITGKTLDECLSDIKGTASELSDILQDLKQPDIAAKSASSLNIPETIKSDVRLAVQDFIDRNFTVPTVFMPLLTTCAYGVSRYGECVVL